MDIFGFEIDESDIRIFITLASPFIIWFLKQILSDFSLGAPILVTVENTDESVRFHLYNRTSKRFVIYGAFLSRSERLRIRLKLSEDTVPESGLTFKVCSSDLSSCLSEWNGLLHLNDDHQPAKLILDTSRGCFYSQWMMIDGSKEHTIVSRHFGHKDAFYTLRRRPAKHISDAALVFYFLAMFLFFPAIVLHSGLSSADMDFVAISAFVINVLIFSYYAGYGLERIYYALFMAILSLAPSAPIFYSLDGFYTITAFFMFSVFVLFSMFYTIAGYSLNKRPDGRYYLYDFHHNENLEHDFLESRKRKSLGSRIRVLYYRCKATVKSRLSERFSRRRRRSRCPVTIPIAYYIG